jgi:REP element-mobilizing transposase RayT
MGQLLGVHLCWGAYGFWLPNDPRGSGSEYVWSEDLRPFGDATKVEDRSRSKARVPHDRRQRLAAKRALKYPAVRFTGVQARAIGIGFGALAKEIGLAVWACAILPDHVHLVVGPHSQPADVLAARFKMAGTGRLKRDGLHPFGHLAGPSGGVPKCWQRGEWKVYLFDATAVRREIEYVEKNPLKEGKPRQRWPFVTPYAG